MKTRQRFLRTRNGVTAFCVVELDSEDSGQWSVEWNSPLSEMRSLYGAAVECGVERARSARQPGKPQRITVTALERTMIDTTPDAVTCATAMALWEAWGVSQDGVSTFFEDGEWYVALG